MGPAFLRVGHHLVRVEQGRVMGFLIEKIDGVNGETGDLDHDARESIVKRLHSLGIDHGDLNKYNFIIGPNRTTVIEDALKNGSKEAMEKAFAILTEQLTDEIGRGPPTMPS